MSPIKWPWVDTLLGEPDNRLLLALVRLVVEPHDSLAWVTILCFTKQVGEKFRDQVYAHARANRCTFAKSLLLLADTDSVGFHGTSSRKAKSTICAVTSWVNDVKWPDEMPDDGWTNWVHGLPAFPLAIEPTDKLFELMGNVEGQLDDKVELGGFLNQLGPLGKDFANARAEGVRIMSLASSKGLTVRGTIIAACEDGIIPREGQNRSEEARLMYVGMTRSRETLYCTWARQRGGPTARAGRASVGKPRRPSGFFDSGPVTSQRGDHFLE